RRRAAAPAASLPRRGPPGAASEERQPRRYRDDAGRCHAWGAREWMLEERAASGMSGRGSASGAGSPNAAGARPGRRRVKSQSAYSASGGTPTQNAICPNDADATCVTFPNCVTVTCSTVLVNDAVTFAASLGADDARVMATIVGVTVTPSSPIQ